MCYIRKVMENMLLEWEKRTNRLIDRIDKILAFINSNPYPKKKDKTEDKK